MTSPLTTGEQPRYVPVPAAMSDSDQRTAAVLIHLSPIAASFVGLPFLGPLIGYLLVRDRGDFVRFHAAQALNLQLTTLLSAMVAGLLLLVLVGFVLLPAVAVASLVLMVIAAVRAGRGELWRIPVIVQFVR